MGCDRFKNKLHILSWNANGLFPRLDELRDFATAIDPDIILIQETRLHQDRRSLSIPNYSHYFNFRPSPPPPHKSKSIFGGTAIFIKNHLTHYLLPPVFTSTIEHTLLRLNIPALPGLAIGSVYARHNSKVPIQRDLEEFCKQLDRFILMGDFNAHHKAWNCPRNNTKGIGIYNFAVDNDLIIATPAAPTHYSHTGSPTIIDFALLANLNHAFHIYTHQSLTSDHLPVSLVIDLNRPLPTVPKNTFTNWQHFNSLLANCPLLIPTIKSDKDIDEAIENLTNTVLQAKTMATKPVNKPPTIRLPSPVLALIKERNKTRKRWQLFKTSALKKSLNAQTRVIQEKIKIIKNSKWEEKINSLSDEDHSIFKFARMLKGRKQFIPPLNTTTGQAFSTEEKVEALADHYEQQFQPNPDIYCEETTQQVESTLEAFLSTPSTFKIAPIFPSDTYKLIGTLNPNKAAGPDGITNRMIQNFPFNIIFYLTFIYNNMLSHSYFPTPWKKAAIVPIFKPGENPTLPKSYRPISLLSSLGKMGEKIIATAINEFTEANDIIPPEQYGFRSKHSTTHQLYRVVETISGSLAMKDSTGAIFYDISKAFDRVYQDGLIYKMITLDFPDSYIHLIHSYLTNRKFIVKYNNLYSSPRIILASVPQGSTLAPLLFNIFISDFPRHPATLSALFADDTAILCSHRKPRYITDRLQEHADMIEDWCEKWRIKLNAAKTHFVLFTRKLVRPQPIFVEGIQLRPERTVKYLGVTLDKTLTWENHIKLVIQKYNIAKANIAPLLYSSSLTFHNKALLFKSILRPTLLYACPVWNFAAKSHHKKLQTAENKTLRGIRKAPRYLRNSIIRKDLQIKTLQFEIRKLSSNFFQKLPTIPNETLFNIEDYDPRDWKFRKRPKAILYK